MVRAAVLGFRCFLPALKQNTVFSRPPARYCTGLPWKRLKLTLLAPRGFVGGAFHCFQKQERMAVGHCCRPGLHTEAGVANIGYVSTPSIQGLAGPGATKAIPSFNSPTELSFCFGGRVMPQAYLAHVGHRCSRLFTCRAFQIRNPSDTCYVLDNVEMNNTWGAVGWPHYGDLCSPGQLQPSPLLANGIEHGGCCEVIRGGAVQCQHVLAVLNPAR